MPNQISESPPQFWMVFGRARAKSWAHYQKAGVRLINRWGKQRKWPAIQAFSVDVAPDPLGGEGWLVSVGCRVWEPLEAAPC